MDLKELKTRIENVDKELKTGLVENRKKSQGSIKDSFLYFFAGGMLMQIPQFTNVIAEPPKEEVEAISLITSMMELMSTMFFFVGLTFMMMGVLKLKSAAETEPRIEVKDFNFKEKDLVCYIALYNKYKNKKFREYVEKSYKELLEIDKLKLKNVSNEELLKGMKTLESKITKEEKVKLEKLNKKQEKIEKEIKESKRILGEEVSEYSIDNE
tara:strand:+ start:5367 stop:6002 length:636 start_codon:yes stop_codon:yes gene_type:complete